MVVVVVCGHQALRRGGAGPVHTPFSPACSPDAATAATPPNHPTTSPISLLRRFISYLEKKQTQKHYCETHTHTHTRCSESTLGLLTNAGNLRIVEMPGKANAKSARLHCS